MNEHILNPTNALIAKEDCRWYTRDGNPAEQIPKKDGKGLKNANITDARALKLIPGVTSILNRMNADELTNWKISQRLRYAAELPYDKAKWPTVEEWIKFIDQTSKDWLSKVGDIGKDIHRELDEFFTQGVEPVSVAGKRACLEIRFTLEKLGADPKTLIFEQPVVNLKIGAGGRPDVRCMTCKDAPPLIGDFKTTDLAKYGKPYYRQGVQLGAYLTLLEWPEDTRLVQIPVDRNTGECQFYIWGQQWDGTRSPSFCNGELSEAFRLFAAEWRLFQNYDPRTA